MDSSTQHFDQGLVPPVRYSQPLPSCWPCAVQEWGHRASPARKQHLPPHAREAAPELVGAGVAASSCPGGATTLTTAPQAAMEPLAAPRVLPAEADMDGEVRAARMGPWVQPHTWC